MTSVLLRYRCCRRLIVSRFSPLFLAAHVQRMQLCDSASALSSTTAAPQRLGGQVGTKSSQGQLVEEAVAHLAAGHHTLVDIGANLADSSFDKDREAVLQRALHAGLEAIVVTGSCVRTTEAAAQLAEASEGHAPPLYFTAGVHPHNARRCDAATLPALRQLAAHPRCVAIGEAGLDFNRNFSPPESQERWFAAQVALAEELSLPLFMHCRDAGPRFLQLLRQLRPGGGIAGVLHCFTGDRGELEAALALGLHIGATGWVCDERPERGGADLAELLPLIPDDRLLLETDAPYLTPRTVVPRKARPSRNEPALLPFVLERVAQARGQSAEHVARVTTENARRLFNLRHPPL